MYTGLTLLFPALMAYAAASDLLTMTISNKVSALLIVGFLSAAALVGMPLAQIGSHLLVGAVVLALTFGCFALGWMGGGDAKLMAATALWFGPTQDLISYVMLSSIFGGILTLSLIVTRAQFAPATGVEFVDRLLRPKTGIPYGIALGLAGLFVFADSAWINGL